MIPFSSNRAMNGREYITPVLVLNCKLGALAIMRTLGSLGVPLYGIDGDPRSPGLLSRYCRDRFIRSYSEEKQEEYLEYVLEVGKKAGKGTILIPTSDELAVFVAKYAEPLSGCFNFPRNDPSLFSELISKEGMYRLAREHSIPTPHTIFPKKPADVLEFAGNGQYPVMLKGIHGNRLQEKTGKKMVIIKSREELIESYRNLEDPERPNLMIQEYIPGDDDQIYIFNGYFDVRSECLAAFTGHKIRQFPVHVGCASLGACTWNPEVAELTTGFMKRIGYKGILDIGYRWDSRDGLYKVLDINPRIGQAFRLFLSENGMDVARSLYLDLTGQEQVHPIRPREGRRWVIEDMDIVSSYHYYQEGSLNFVDWLRSFKNLEEGAWFHWKDPAPFLFMLKNLSTKFLKWIAKRLKSSGNGNR